MRYTVKGVCGDTGATHGGTRWLSRPRRLLGARLCGGAGGKGLGGDDEAAYRAASAAPMVMVREGYYLVHRSGPLKKQ